MGLAERAAYLEFLANSKGALGTHDAQFPDAAALAALQRFEVGDVAKVHLQLTADQLRQFLLRVLHRPAVEVGRLLVVVVEHLRQHVAVVGVAIGTRDGRQVGFRGVLPAILELLRLTAAALREAGVAQLSLIGEHLSACSLHGLGHSRDVGVGDALIALAMVVGTDVEDGVVLAVVPTDAFALAFDEGEERRRLLGMFLPAKHLRIEPAAADDCRSLQELQRATALHLAADDACQVVFDGQDVDGNNHKREWFEPMLGADTPFVLDHHEADTPCRSGV